VVLKTLAVASNMNAMDTIETRTAGTLILIA